MLHKVLERGLDDLPGSVERGLANNAMQEYE